MEMSKNCVFVFYFSPLQIKSLPQEPEEVVLLRISKILVRLAKILLKSDFQK